MSVVQPCVGDTVLVCVGNRVGDGEFVYRPAVVTEVFTRGPQQPVKAGRVAYGGENTLVNVTIFLDGHNDQPGRLQLSDTLERDGVMFARGYSRLFGTGTGRWHWPGTLEILTGGGKDAAPDAIALDTLDLILAEQAYSAAREADDPSWVDWSGLSSGARSRWVTAARAVRTYLRDVVGHL